MRIFLAIKKFFINNNLKFEMELARIRKDHSIEEINAMRTKLLEMNSGELEIKFIHIHFNERIARAIEEYAQELSALQAQMIK